MDRKSRHWIGDPANARHSDGRPFRAVNREETLNSRLEQLERLVREGLQLRSSLRTEYESYATSLRTAVEDYLHALRQELRKRHHPDGIPDPEWYVGGKSDST